MSCCGAAKWKREHIEGHKFDLIDVDDFVDNSCLTQLEYSSVFIFTLKSVLVYMADLGVILLLIITAISSGIDKVTAPQVSDGQNKLKKEDQLIPIDPQTRFWLIMATVLLSYVLLAVEWRKAMMIVKSRDISYAFTNAVAYRYYVIRSYPHFCLFDKIQGSRKPIDRLAFWVFFTFRGWKRLLLADFPRQCLNFALLYDSLKQTMNAPEAPLSNGSQAGFCSTDSFGNKLPPVNSTFTCQPPSSVGLIDATGFLLITQNDKLAAAQAWLSSLTVLIWTISAIQLVAAFFIYIPLLLQIRGNLKEYCCHKVDKRIAEVLRKKSKKRAEQERKRAQKEIAKYGKTSRPEPTLPNVDVGAGEQYAYYESQSIADGSDYSSAGGYNDTSLLYQQQQQQIYYPPGAPSAYGSSSVTGSSAYGGAPLPNPYVQSLAQGAPQRGPSPYQQPPPPGSYYDYSDTQSEFGAPPSSISIPLRQQPPMMYHQPPPPQDPYAAGDSSFYTTYSDVGYGPSGGSNSGRGGGDAGHYLPPTTRQYGKDSFR